MKKVKFTLALSMLLATACTQNEDLAVIAPEGNEGSNGNISLTASFDGGTRTNSPDGIITKWVEGDDIYVGASGAMNKFSLHDGAGTTTGIFTASGVTIEGDLYAVYGPFANGTPSISETSITGISIPDTWEYSSTKNSENCIMAGKVNTINKTVAFKNAGAILYITIGGGITIDQGTKLTVTTTTTPITGAATITASESAPKYTCAGDGKTITITGLSSATEQKIVIPMPAISTAEVITVKLVGTDENNNNVEKLIFSESATLERNKYYSIKYTTAGEQAVFSEAGLTAALAAGNKVVLGKDITLSDDYTLSENITGATIDLNGHKLSSASQKKIITNGKTLSIIGTTEGSSLEVSDITATADLTLTNVTLSGNIAITAGNLTITGGTITGKIDHSGTGNIEYTGGTLNGYIQSTGGTNNKVTNVAINNASGDYGIKATSENYDSNNASTFTISGGSITANKTAVYVKYTNLDISGCGLKVSSDQPTTPNGDGFCIAIMGGSDVSTAPAKGSITLGKAPTSTGAGDGKPNTYTVASGNTNNVYVFANESSHTDLTITNNDNAKIQWKTPATNP